MKVICINNYLDGDTANVRGIATYSQAASNKVVAISSALMAAGVNVSILSMGRGRQNGSGDKHPASQSFVTGISVTYSAYWHVPILTHLVSAFSLASCLWKQCSRSEAIQLLVYNRRIHYLPAIIVARLLGAKCYQDIEDGDLYATMPTWRSWVFRSINWLFDVLCSKGALLACRQLAEQTSLRYVQPCYGYIKKRNVQPKNWSAQRLIVIFGGNLVEEQGVGNFMEAISTIYNEHPEVAQRYEIYITGRGPYSEQLLEFSFGFDDSFLKVRTGLSYSEYENIMASAHIGLNLRLPGYEMSESTFPSKVMEIAGFGQLLLSTQLSDIEDVFKEGEYLPIDGNAVVSSVVDALIWIDQHRPEAESMAKNCQVSMLAKYSCSAVGSSLAVFFKEGGRVSEK